MNRARLEQKIAQSEGALEQHKAQMQWLEQQAVELQKQANALGMAIAREETRLETRVSCFARARKSTRRKPETGGPKGKRKNRRG